MVKNERMAHREKGLNGKHFPETAKTIGTACNLFYRQ